MLDIEELTRQEKILAQILIEVIDAEATSEYIKKVLRKAGLTKEQAEEALDRSGH